jgi:hypothetical protein
MKVVGAFGLVVVVAIKTLQTESGGFLARIQKLAGLFVRKFMLNVI